MKLRNIAIIAHVDHGKTTLVDRLLQQSGAFRDNQRVAERVMDSNDLERERGITILAKATSVVWKDVRINIVDTPGHADFGGEVERILSMVDGAIVLVDASEGPMPQTKFVVGKALKIGLKPSSASTRSTSPTRAPSEVVNECFDLFAALDATDEQLDFRSSTARPSRAGWRARPTGRRRTWRRCSTCVLKHVEPPKVGGGRLSHARHAAGGQSLSRPCHHRPGLLGLDQGQCAGQGARPAGQSRRAGPGLEILAFRGIERAPIDEAEAGDIVAIAGWRSSTSPTRSAARRDEPLQAQPIDPPTLSMTFLVNDSPLAGTEGDKVTSRVIRDRLFKEAEGNVALRVEPAAQFRRLCRLGPRRIAARHPDRDHAPRGLRTRRFPARRFSFAQRRGEMLEPIEEVVIDVDEEHSGVVVQKMSERKGEMVEMRPSGGGRLRLVFLAPTRGLIGYLGELMTDTRGTAVMNRLFHDWGHWKGEIAGGATAS